VEVGRALMESTLPTLSHKGERMGQPASQCDIELR